MKSHDMLIKRILFSAVLLGSTAIYADDQTTTTATTTAATAPAAVAPAGTTTTTTTTKTPAAPAVNPANVDSNKDLQKCIDTVPKDANGAPNGDDMRACVQKAGTPTNLAAPPKIKPVPSNGSADVTN